MELTLQIKPVGNHCNLCCSYCYAAPFKSEKFNILPLELLEKIIKEGFEISNNLIISWHGGEPTLVGIDYFKRYIDIVNKYKIKGKNIANMIQTNATLINDELAQFFKDNDFIVSISLDGDEISHNKNRYDYSKVGSFSKAMKGVEILRKHGINPPVIVTVSKSTYEDGTRNFEFLVDNGFKEIKYSPVYDSNEDNFSINDKEWFEYLKNILYKWLDMKREDIIVREIDEELMFLANKSANLCSNRGLCSTWISIDELGNIYPCEYLRYNHPYGNIRDTNIKDVFNSKNYKDFKEEIIFSPDECSSCKLEVMCHNGCPATRIKDNELVYNGKYVYCNTKKMLHDEIIKILS